jgi:hypothetical protein
LTDVSSCEVRVDVATDSKAQSTARPDWLSKVHIGTTITQNQSDNLQEVLQKNVFSEHDNDIGFCDSVEHKIYTTDDVPVKVPHRRVPPSQWEEVRKYLTDAVERGVIRPSCSPYAAPVVLARKKNGDLRLCVDYRQLNAPFRVLKRLWNL